MPVVTVSIGPGAASELLDLATLEGLSARELEATAAKLVNRRDGWREFGLFFSTLADERRGHRAWGAGDLPLSSVDRPLERIKDAEPPFWRHVRAAVEACRSS
jgi:hypothetical protein